MGSWYDEKADVLNIEVEDEKYWNSIELSDDVVIDVSRDGKIISIEILEASKIFFGDSRKVIEMAKIADKE